MSPEERASPEWLHRPKNPAASVVGEGPLEKALVVIVFSLFTWPLVTRNAKAHLSLLNPPVKQGQTNITLSSHWFVDPGDQPAKTSRFKLPLQSIVDPFSQQWPNGGTHKILEACGSPLPPDPIRVTRLDVRIAWPRMPKMHMPRLRTSRKTRNPRIEL